MSYDLFFQPRHGTFTVANFDAYFRNRKHYSCEGSQAWYQNEDTGVYFVFEFHSYIEGDLEEGEDLSPVSLNINYIRPSYFILEAEPEVTAFVKSFDLLVSDPQTDGMGEGEYSSEKLLSGWNAGNEFGYSAIFREDKEATDVYHLPTRVLLDVWKWNLHRKSLQQNIGENRFVPRIMFFCLNDVTVTAAVWPDGIPIIAPKVDYLLVGREELAPVRFFRKKNDMTFVAWEDALRIFQKYGTENADASITLNYEAPPADVIAFIKGLPAEKRTISGISADNVLNREIVESIIGR